MEIGKDLDVGEVWGGDYVNFYGKGFLGGVVELMRLAWLWLALVCRYGYDFTINAVAMVTKIFCCHGYQFFPFGNFAKLEILANLEF